MEVSFLTNNLEFSAQTIAELYRARWGIETFFRELKQTCQIHNFIGYSENAVRWQVWAGLIAHLLLRYIRYVAEWGHSFSRLAGVIRGSPWLKKRLLSLLALYGTAGAEKPQKTASGARCFAHGFTGQRRNSPENIKTCAKTQPKTRLRRPPILSMGCYCSEL